MNQEEKYYLYKEKNFGQRFFGHLGTVLKHKRNVCKGCFKMGLYGQGLFHDMSKFSLTEFAPSVKYYSGRLSPNAVDRKLNGASLAWLHHKGRNRHHFEYWIDFSASVEGYAFGCRMPLRYVAEMVADRYAACVAYNGAEYKQSDPWDYYCIARKVIIMHPDTRTVLEKALTIMRDEGEDAAFSFMKDLLKKCKGSDYTAESLGIEPIPSE
ncbi:MAG: DUF5662 family protein [Lachnospiraceae bacterium]|nr:DUF5662 family protein [Lachnospiraceae bacterium]